MRFSEAIDKYNQFKRLEKEVKTIRGYDLDLRQFCLWMRNNPLITQVTIDHIIEYVNGMKELGWSQNTIMIKCVVLTGFFKFWLKKGYPVLNYELIPHVKREYVEARVATDEKLSKLITVCNEHEDDPYFIRMKALILLAADTGARNGEICSINADISTEPYERYQDCNQYSHIIKSEKSRGKKPFRRIFWEDETNDALNKWLMYRKTIPNVSEALFVGLGGQGARNVGGRISVQAIAICMRKISAMAGIPNVNLHSLRHRKGNQLGAGGANGPIISDILGHASTASSDRYTHLNDKQLSKAHHKYKRVA